MTSILRDGDLSLLSGKVAVLGYGSQGHAHALNLRDSGIEVEVGLRDGSSSRAEAASAGLAVGSFAEATRGAQLVAILLPDQVQPQIFEGPRRAEPRAGCCDSLRARLQRAVRADRRRNRSRRDHGRAEGARARGATALHGGLRHTRADRGRAGRERPRPRPRARVRGRHRCRARRNPGDDVPGRRPRPTSSASRPSSAVAPRSSCAPVSRRSSKRATSPRSRTTNACTSSR